MLSFDPGYDRPRWLTVDVRVASQFAIHEGLLRKGQERFRAVPL